MRYQIIQIKEKEEIVQESNNYAELISDYEKMVKEGKLENKKYIFKDIKTGHTISYW